MKILYITNYGDMYGANKSLFTMITILKECYGVEPYVLISGAGGGMGEACSNAQISCFEHDFRISAINENTENKQVCKVTRRIMRYVDFFKVFLFLKKQNIKFDMIHSNSSVFDIGLFLAQKWNIPHVWHVREYAKEDYGLEMVYGQAAVRKKYLASAAVIAISKAIEGQICKLSDKINIRQIYNGVILPEKYVKEFRQNDIVRFCIIGSLVPKKNQLDVVKACKQLLENGYKNFHLYIVGDTGGSYYNKICEYMKNNDELNEYVTFTGYCKNINQFLKDKDVGIMASDKEAFGRVTVEYLANYMPVIGTDTGGTTELLKGIGKFYEPHDIDILANAMSFYINNRDALIRNALKMRSRAEQFDAGRNAEEVYRLYGEVVNNYAR